MGPSSVSSWPTSATAGSVESKGRYASASPEPISIPNDAAVISLVELKGLKSWSDLGISGAARKRVQSGASATALCNQTRVGVRVGKDHCSGSRFERMFRAEL